MSTIRQDGITAGLPRRRDMLKTTMAATAAMLVPAAEHNARAGAVTAGLDTGRRRELLDSNWRFIPADIALQAHANSGETILSGPASVNCDDRAWRIVELPHDYIVEGKYDRRADCNHGFLPVYPAWYRRHIHLNAGDRGKSIWIDFDGIYRDAHVYLNGRFIGRHQGGYTPFRLDISRVANYGGDNILAIHVDPRAFEGWWYEGGGIYRHVWLNVADQLHVAPWGVYIISDVHDVLTTPSADLTIESRVTNASDYDQDCIVKSTVIDAHGQAVAGISNPVRVPAGKDIKITQVVALQQVKLWSLEDTALYILKTDIQRRGKTIDSHLQKFGVRTLRFDADHGFFLNGRPVKIKGTCNHQDFPGVGIGAADSLWFWRVRKLKEMGCNAIHCTKNMMADALYDACDQLGMLVMDENRRLGDTYNPTTRVGDPYTSTQHVETMVLRDRNHPSVIIWSICNDEHIVQDTAYGAGVFRTIKAAILRHDRTRPVSCSMSAGGARGDGWDAEFTHLEGFAQYADIQGVDFDPFNYDAFHRAFPNQPMLAGETGSNTSDRGIYASAPQAGYIDAYHGNPEASWRPVALRDFIAGGFVWTGFDFRGEPVPYKWPCISSHFGILDMCGFPKDNGMYYKACWKQAPLVHIFPHWNWPGHENKPISVWCYSNCDEIELRVNSKSLGRRRMPRFSHLQWTVPYHPGVIEAVGYKSHVVVASHIIHTTGAPAGIVLTPDRTRLLADGRDVVPVAVAVVDSAGRLVPTAGNKIHFTVTGAATLAGVANGDPSCHEPNQADYRSSFNGLCMVLVRAGRKPGKIHIAASAGGISRGEAILHAARI